jgi:broad specificity phosphatase PhoE
MRKAALYVHGRVVIADSHMLAYQQLTHHEKESHITSGVFDSSTKEFESDLPEEHFYNIECVLIRHGHVTDSNEPDAPLSPVGIQKVNELCKTLKNFDFKDFTGITSPLLRCLQTSLIIYEKLHIDFKTQASLMELPWFLNQKKQYRLQNHKLKFPQFSWESNDDFIINYESNEDFLERTKLALQNFQSKVIVITHYGFIVNAIRLALCKEKVVSDIAPASLTYINNQDLMYQG